MERNAENLWTPQFLSWKLHKTTISYPTPVRPWRQVWHLRWISKAVVDQTGLLLGVPPWIQGPELRQESDSHDTQAQMMKNDENMRKKKTKHIFVALRTLALECKNHLKGILVSSGPAVQCAVTNYFLSALWRVAVSIWFPWWISW